MRRTHGIMVGVVTAASIALGGCTPVARTTPPARATETAPYDFRKEGEIPAAPQRAPEEPDVVEMPVEDAGIEVEEAEVPRDTTTQAVLIDGYRVQVFATASRDVADGARRTARSRTGESAYVEAVDGLYKVRLGNCRTRAAAEKLLEKVRSGYYKDAWIVETRIEVPPGTEGD